MAVAFEAGHVALAFEPELHVVSSASTVLALVDEGDEADEVTRKEIIILIFDRGPLDNSAFVPTEVY
jgi:hypothetical protein